MSGARVLAQHRLAVPFELFVLSADPASCALAHEARPKALRVSVVRTLDEVVQCLESYALVCGIVVDAELDTTERISMLRAIRERWSDVPALALVRAASARALALAQELGTTWVFKMEEPAHQARRMAEFMRKALDDQLWRAARLVHQARTRELPPLPLETFVTLVVRSIPRSVAEQRLRLTDKQMDARVKELCKAWGGVQRLVDLSFAVDRSVVRDAPPDVVEELERLATDELEEELTQLFGS